MTKLSREEMIKFLREHGWSEDRRTTSVWRWFEPRYPLAKYRLQDAYELAKGRVRT